MKILILGDIHGRTIWKDIIEKESPDKVIFLGDYVSTHDNISSETQIANLNDILDYKEANSSKVILLRGNHDIQHLGYYWAECSGLDPKVWQHMSESNFKERFLKLTQWVHIDDDLKVISSFTLIYARAGAPTLFIYSSIDLYQEFDLSIFLTVIPLIKDALNGSNELLLNISVKSSITNGFLKSGLSEPYLSIASLNGILLNGLSDTSLSLK